MESILTSIKKLLGVAESDFNFDDDIIMHINSVFMILNQIGIGSDAGFSITDASNRWCDYIDDITKYNSVKTYVYLKVRLIFDPPSSSAVIESMNRTISELEWRIYTAAETNMEVIQNE